MALSGENRMFQEFKKFAMRGNVIDLAVGVIIGASFTGIVNSLVKDVIMPPIGMALGGVDFSNFFFVIKGDRAVDTLAAATAAKDVTINYGLFVNAVINFLIVAFVLFILLRQLNKLVAPSPSTEAAPPPSEEILLLREIRDSLKARG
jgi:large conductance mechanosensitive channel